MTEAGTNTYILGSDRVAIIDPGPALSAHMRAIHEVLDRGEVISHIFVTHSHLDHSPLARLLSQQTGAPVFAFGPSDAGRSPVMADLQRTGLIGGGEGVDAEFAPDITLADGEVVSADTWGIEAIHTPGHMANHMCFAAQGALFTGDHIMGWASSLISPPDGDLGAFMASCRRLTGRQDRIFYPGHGAPVENPQDRLNWLVTHREGREAQVIEALGDGPATPAELTAKIYHDTDPRLHPAALRNVLAHLIDLWERNLVHAEPALHPDARFSLT
jgi:glyoxylase-like metal-dependent hydrolase (beta-lactamase superfamily II)